MLTSNINSPNFKPIWPTKIENSAKYAKKLHQEGINHKVTDNMARIVAMYIE